MTRRDISPQPRQSITNPNKFIVKTSTTTLPLRVTTKITKATNMNKRTSKRKGAIKNTEEPYPNADTKVSNTTRMACVRIATMPKEGRRKLQPVSIKIELCMPKVYAKTATCPFIIKLNDQLKDSQAKINYQAPRPSNEQLL